MKALCAALMALVAAGAHAAAEDTPKQAPDDAQLVRSIGRSASRLLEVATHISAHEKATVRRKLANSAWTVQDVDCELRYMRRDDGIHERRNHCSASVDRGISDLSQLILLFAPAMIGRYSFQRAATVYDVGPLGAVMFRYQQREGPDSVSVKDGKKVQRMPVHGVVWVATDGSVVYRVSLDNDAAGGFRDHAEVNYAIDLDSAVVPVSASWQLFKSDDLVAETSARYTRIDKRP